VPLSEEELHLLEQTELLFREWHRTSHRSSPDLSPGDVQSRQRLGIPVAGLHIFVTEPCRYG